MNSSASAAAAAAGCRPPFTASQWQELEHQALIFKYLMAGIPVPPDLLLPIRKSLETMAARFYHHPTMGYCSFYGKKVDPEPGRCRRTDGKKWRCSKEAHPDSKYCERHMHRGRNRSRKPVETQTISQTPQSSSSSPPSSTVTSLAPPSAGGGSSGGGVGSSLPSGIPLQALAGVSGGGSSVNQVSLAGTNLSQQEMDQAPFGMGGRDYGYHRGVKSEADAYSFFAEASGSARGGLGNNNDFSLDSSWRLMPSPASYVVPKAGSSSLLQSHYSQLQPMFDFSHGTITSISKQQQQHQQHCFFGSDFDSAEVKPESQPLRPFFDEWPKTRGDSWSELEDDRSNRASFSTTQLSISIPMASSSDFSTTSSRSPNDD